MAETNDSKLYEKILARREVFSGKLIRVEHWDAELASGRVSLREIVKNANAAAVVPVDADGNVTLVRQYRVAMGEIMMEIPAGKKDDIGEDSLVCPTRAGRRNRPDRAELAAAVRRAHVAGLPDGAGFHLSRHRSFAGRGSPGRGRIPQRRENAAGRGRSAGARRQNHRCENRNWSDDGKRRVIIPVSGRESGSPSAYGGNPVCGRSFCAAVANFFSFWQNMLNFYI